MSNKNIIEINENKLENVSGGVAIIEDSIAEDGTAEYNRKKKILLRGGLMLGVLAVAYVGLSFLQEKYCIDPNSECMAVADDIRCCCRCEFF